MEGLTFRSEVLQGTYCKITVVSGLMTTSYCGTVRMWAKRQTLYKHAFSVAYMYAKSFALRRKS